MAARRVVGDYDAEQVDALRDDSRTGLPIIVCDRFRAPRRVEDGFFVTASYPWRVRT